MNSTTHYLTVSQWAALWARHMDPRNARRWCREGRVAGAIKIGRDWIIPADAPDSRMAIGNPLWGRKPTDARLSPTVVRTS